jgi:hypothetical protein
LGIVSGRNELPDRTGLGNLPDLLDRFDPAISWTGLALTPAIRWAGPIRKSDTLRWLQFGGCSSRLQFGC